MTNAMTAGICITSDMSEAFVDLITSDPVKGRVSKNRAVLEDQHTMCVSIRFNPPSGLKDTHSSETFRVD